MTDRSDITGDLIPSQPLSEEISGPGQAYILLSSLNSYVRLSALLDNIGHFAVKESCRSWEMGVLIKSGLAVLNPSYPLLQYDAINRNIPLTEIGITKTALMIGQAHQDQKRARTCHCI